MQRSEEASQVTYAPAEPAVTRRAFRLLLILTAINTILLGSYVAGPGLQIFVKSQWASYEARKAAHEKEVRDRRTAAARDASNAADRVAMLPMQQQCLDYTFPKMSMIYSEVKPAPESGDRAAADAQKHWPVMYDPPACFAVLPRGLHAFHDFCEAQHVPIFIHARSASASSPTKLVVVFLDRRAEHSIQGHELVAYSCTPGTKDSEISSDGYSKGGCSTQLDLQLFGGEIDSNDPSRFVIPYRMRGADGKIFGSLRADGIVDLAPSGELAKHWTHDKSESRMTGRR